jgi:hypothetical protein
LSLRVLPVLVLLGLSACSEPSPAHRTLPAAPTESQASEVRPHLMTKPEIEDYLANRKMSCRSDSGSGFGLETQAGGGMIYNHPRTGRVTGSWRAFDGFIEYSVWNVHSPVIGPLRVRVSRVADGVMFGSDHCRFL